MVYEPKPSQAPRGTPGNPFQGRWRGWYSSIADYQLRNPGCGHDEIAASLGKHVNTIRYIVTTDMYKDYFHRRRQEWTRLHDLAIITKTTAVAERALDLMLDKMEKQADKIPMNLITEVATSALDRLGYAPKSTAPVEVNINNNSDNRQVVVVPISAGALEEARDALRAAEAARMMESRKMLELEAEPEEIEGSSPSIEDL